MLLRVCKTTVRFCNFYVDVTQASSERRDSQILRVNKIRDPKILRVYNISVRDCNFYVDVTEAK